MGLAGPSGSGKSTLVRVLLRLTHPTSGSALLGGVAIENVSRETIGQLVGYVGQSPFLFAGTISANIAYGCDEADEPRIREAAELAGIHDEIMALADGYQSLVQEQGHNLSGGQRQRIALARVFLKNPPLLVLDEGTSALDTISEHHVQQAIEKLRPGRTIMIVAHRLSTLQTADRILVFQNGRIAQSGTIDELTECPGIFTEMLCSRQPGGQLGHVVRIFIKPRPLRAATVRERILHPPRPLANVFSYGGTACSTPLPHGRGS